MYRLAVLCCALAFLLSGCKAEDWADCLKDLRGDNQKMRGFSDSTSSDSGSSSRRMSSQD